MSTSTTTGGLNPNVFDIGGLAALKRPAKDGDPKALKAAAQQFEALFLQMVLKSMRDAVPRDGLFDSEQTRLYESLLDQQMVQVLGASSGGTGLAAMIEKQLLQQNPEPQAFEDPLPLLRASPFLRFRGEPMIPLAPDANREPLPPPGLPTDATLAPRGNLQASPAAGAAVLGSFVGASAAMREFANRLAPAATEAARATGIPAHFMVAQAALETGWGKSEPRRADGGPSFNVFGIKAGRGWPGPVAEATTTEYVDGVAQKQTERFRVYASYAEAFRDYAAVLSANPRYAAVLGAQDAASFAGGLQRAGFASDPLYASKLERIIDGMARRPVSTG